MRILISADGMTITQATAAFTRRRLLFALGRFDGSVERVTVRFSDDNGPRAGGLRCKVIVVPRFNPGFIVIEETGDELRTIAGRAAQRAGRTLARSINRTQERRRGRIPALQTR